MEYVSGKVKIFKITITYNNICNKRKHNPQITSLINKNLYIHYFELSSDAETY